MARNRMAGARALVLAVAALALAVSSARAAAWWRLPLWGAEVRVFAIDPFEAGVVYCGTSRGNFYGSRDGGATWEPLSPDPLSLLLRHRFWPTPKFPGASGPRSRAS
jgi:hypothetical protein